MTRHVLIDPKTGSELCEDEGCPHHGTAHVCVPSGRAKRAGGPIADLPAPTHRHPMSGEPIWDQHAVRALCNALRDTLAWMESLRASGDAGFWDWEDDDEYTRGVAVLHQHAKES